MPCTSASISGTSDALTDLASSYTVTMMVST